MDDARRCTAHSSRSGERCKKAPILGGFVCRTHGGSAPQVMRSANQRLLALQPPAVDALAEALDAHTAQLNRRGEVVGLGPDHAVRIGPATSVLDRTGIGPSSSTDVTVSASLHLMELIEELDG